MADLDPEMGGGGGEKKIFFPPRVWSKKKGGGGGGGGGGHKKFFFRPQFGLKISGVRGALGPLAPPLDPRLTTQI